MVPHVSVLLGAVVLAGCGAPSLPSDPSATVAGRALVFGDSGGGLAGASLGLAEAPSPTGTLDADAKFSLAVPRGASGRS